MWPFKDIAQIHSRAKPRSPLPFMSVYQLSGLFYSLKSAICKVIRKHNFDLTCKGLKTMTIEYDCDKRLKIYHLMVSPIKMRIQKK